MSANIIIIITLTPAVNAYGGVDGLSADLRRDDGQEVTEVDLLLVQTFCYGLIFGEGVTSATALTLDGGEIDLLEGE